MGRMHRLSRTQLVDRPIEEVFAFFADPSNLEALTPPFLRFRILTPMPIAMRAGARLDYQLTLFGVPVRWRTRITDWQPGKRFVDEQESGPYALWRHTHDFQARGSSTVMRDVVDYSVPLGPLGALAHLLFVRRTLDRIFDFRRDAVSRLLGPGQAGADFDIEVFHDGACPLCMREIRMLQRRDRRKRIRFTDIAADGFDAASVGLTWDTLMKRIHGRLPDGTLLEGVEVFRHLYAAVGFGPLVALTRLPVIAQLLDVAYHAFARNRLRLTGRCSDSACELHGQRPRPDVPGS